MRAAAAAAWRPPHSWLSDWSESVKAAPGLFCLSINFIKQIYTFFIVFGENFSLAHQDLRKRPSVLHTRLQHATASAVAEGFSGASAVLEGF